MRILHRFNPISALVASSMLLQPGLAAAFDAPVTLGSSPGQDATPMAENGVAEGVRALQGIVAAAMDRSGVPGVAVAVVHDGQTVFSAGYGVREAGKPDKVTPETVFQLASVSKPLSATIAAVEITKGKAAWNDPVTRYLKGFRLSDPYVTAHATIGDFFAHRSGLPATAGDELEDLGFSRDDILERLAQVPLDPFRISYHYANFGTTVAAEAVAAAAGKPWETLATEALFEPLGMTVTSYRYKDFLAHSNRAALHILSDGSFKPLYQRDADAQAPAGGASSNVLDLAEWLKLLLAEGSYDGAQMISPEALLPALSPQAFSGPPGALDSRPGFYGYGFNVSVSAGGHPMMGHSGAFLLGAGTTVQINPAAETGIVVLTNGSPIGVSESIAASFMDIVQFGAQTRDWYTAYHGAMAHFYEPEGDLAGAQRPADSEPGRALDSYTGRYGNEYFGVAEIGTGGAGLTLTLGPRGDVFELVPWGGDTFAVTPKGENAPEDSRSSVKFTAEGDEVTGFTVQYLDANGLGTWIR